MGDNMFVVELESKRDRERIWAGSPWHVSNHAVLLADFEDCMRPDEVNFDRLHLWARVINLPYNLRDDAWGVEIAKQIDKDATSVQFDHMGGYLRARVSVDVSKPLRRWILIDSARRKRQDLYDIQYENVPHFCFSCGCLGHSDLYCPTPGKRDIHGNLPFGPSLRASDERKKASSNDSSSKQGTAANQSKRESNNSSNVGASKATPEVNSPAKNRPIKRKEVPRQEYRRVNGPLLLMDSGAEKTDLDMSSLHSDEHTDERNDEDGRKKKKPTPDNSAEAAGQPCLSK